MSVNMTLAMNPEKTKHLGKYFHTIDYNTISEGKSIGQLTIGSNKFNLSLMQLLQVIQLVFILENDIEHQKMHVFQPFSVPQLCISINTKFTPHFLLPIQLLFSWLRLGYQLTYQHTF